MEKQKIFFDEISSEIQKNQYKAELENRLSNRNKTNKIGQAKDLSKICVDMFEYIF